MEELKTFGMPQSDARNLSPEFTISQVQIYVVVTAVEFEFAKLRENVDISEAVEFEEYVELAGG